MIDSWLCRKFLEKDYPVLALRRSTSSVKQVEDFSNEVKWYSGDLLDRESLRMPIRQAYYVIHAGALLTTSLKNKALLQQVNVQVTENMADLSLEYGCKKFFFISSESVLGEPWTGQVMDEAMTTTAQPA